MIPLYETFVDDVEIFHKKNSHVSPHLHQLLEFVYVTEGTLELGIGQELYHMETGDFAMIFPGLIHHTQVFCEGESRSVYLLSAPSYMGRYREEMLKAQPECPVIKKEKVHKDVAYALNTLLEEKNLEQKHSIVNGYIQIILARCFPVISLIERRGTEGEDLVYRAVVYIAEHFSEPLNLRDMAKALYTSPYTLSRMFSKIFHMNFNTYINDYRMEYVVNKLNYTNLPITEIWLEAGFESQRTFNRVFREKYHMSPREYRKNI